MKLNSEQIELLQAQTGMKSGSLARAAGISRNTLCTCKRTGSCNPVTAGKIANALGVPVSQIVRKEA